MTEGVVVIDVGSGVGGIGVGGTGVTSIAVGRGVTEITGFGVTGGGGGGFCGPLEM